MTYTVYNKADHMELYTAAGIKDREDLRHWMINTLDLSKDWETKEVSNYYYEQELKKISGNIKVKFYSGGGNTHHMNINNDSIEAIIDFLNNLKGVQK